MLFFQQNGSHFDEKSLFKAQDYLLQQGVESNHLFGLEFIETIKNDRNSFMSLIYLDNNTIDNDLKNNKVDFYTYSNHLLFDHKNFTTNSNHVFSMKNYICDINGCQKTFTSSYGLKYHKIHGHIQLKTFERRPYICQVPGCSKSYKNNNGLKYHIIHAHNDLKLNYNYYS
ncbi:transcriptional repressor, predicted [Enterocytozoon bieneusi H348]|nr:transcriptional repressor, predicted [Enterocytozoon bieneusi H348]|eukprot:XP_002650180.1 transcriptional repressor, predicted [Enterocytozoon bieneusi H348]